MKFHLTGIVSNAPHPFRQTTLSKHNPLQRLAYLLVLIVIIPMIWITGWFYHFNGSWADWGFGRLERKWVAFSMLWRDSR